MHVEHLHSWTITAKEAIALQKELATKVTAQPFDLQNATLIGGLDVSSSKFSTLLTAGVVIWNRETGEVVETASAQAEQTFPYIPGLLSFREIPVLSEALEKLKTTPHVLLVDGQGRAHPRRIGIATHVGLLIDVPTVGVGKSKLCGSYEEPGPMKGNASPLIDKGETIGRVLRTKDRVNPLFISDGNRISLDDAVALVLACGRGYRLPEPTRLAHEHVNLVRTTGKGLPLTTMDATLF